MPLSLEVNLRKVGKEGRERKRRKRKQMMKNLPRKCRERLSRFPVIIHFLLTTFTTTATKIDCRIESRISLPKNTGATLCTWLFMFVLYSAMTLSHLRLTPFSHPSGASFSRDGFLCTELDTGAVETKSFSSPEYLESSSFHWSQHLDVPWELFIWMKHPVLDFLI